MFSAKTLPKIDYAYDALEPHIDAATMTLHHTKHHQAYTDNLNKALTELSQCEAFAAKASFSSVEDLLRIIAREDAGKAESLPWPSPKVRQIVRNNGGGYVNHGVYFANMSPETHALSADSELSKQLTKCFGSLAAFKEQFTAAALGVFGSGWVFLVWVPSTSTLSIVTTANQDIPEFATPYAGTGAVVLLALDVWEHAYYVKYRNMRANYVGAWWNVVNWADVALRFQGGAAKL
ncbi:hypothetical protein BASA62_009786 [Batrachochytrium salamandrivorans]|nr:hypothetical protein BASA62_009786 [Batrachochytrium salamandrivorans]